MSSIVQESLSVSGILLGKTMGRSDALAERFHGESERLADLEVRQRMAGRWVMAIDPDELRRDARGGLLVRRPELDRARRSRSAPWSRSPPCRCALFRPDHVAARRADRHPDVAGPLRPDLRVPRPAGGHRGAPRPRRARPRHAPRRGDLRRRRVRATGPSRRTLDDVSLVVPARLDHGHHRRDRLGQDDARLPGGAPLRRAVGQRVDRRRGRARPGLRVARRRGRRGVAGDLPDARQRAREHPLRPPRGDRRGDRGGGPRRPDPPRHRRAPRGLRHRGRRARLPLLGRREPADRDRAHRAAQPARSSSSTRPRARSTPRPSGRCRRRSTAWARGAP